MTYGCRGSHTRIVSCGTRTLWWVTCLPDVFGEGVAGDGPYVT
jgi:hypothetical protein